MNRDVLVCRCKNVLSGSIIDTVEQGVDTFEKVQNQTGVATGCGHCINKAKAVFEEALANKQNS